MNAIDNAAALRGNVAGCVAHSDRGSQFAPGSDSRPGPSRMVGSMGRVDAAGDNAAMESFFSLLQKNVPSTDAPGPPANSCASRSSPGSSGPTTDAADKTASAV